MTVGLTPLRSPPGSGPYRSAALPPSLPRGYRSSALPIPPDPIDGGPPSGPPRLSLGGSLGFPVFADAGHHVRTMSLERAAFC